jgi:HEAT repeat protein
LIPLPPFFFKKGVYQMKKKIPYIIFSVSVFTGLSLLLCMPSKQLREPSMNALEMTEKAQIKMKKGPVSKRRALEHQPWKAGHHYSYQSELNSSLFFEETTEPMISFSVDGTVAIDVVESDAEKTMLHVQYQSLTLNLFGEDVQSSKSVNKEKLASLEKELKNSFFVVIDEGGALEKVLVPEKMAEHVQNTFKTLASLMQYVAPPEAESTWEATEADRVGDYLAAYVDDSLSMTTTKTKLRYLTGNSGVDGTLETKPEVIESKTTYTWHPKGAIQRLEAIDNVRVASNNVQFTGSSQTDLLMTLESVRPSIKDFSALLALVDSYVSSPPNTPATRFSSQQVIDRAKIAGLDLGTALNIFDRIKGESDEDRHTRQKAFLALEAMFRQNPEAAVQAAKKIRAGSQHAKTLISALGYAGTPQTQDALIDVLNSGYKANPLAVMRALSTGDQPTKENIAFHKEMMNDPDLGCQARFGLGANAQILLQQGMKQKADEIFDLLVEELNNASSQNETVLVLKALGNTGHPGLINVLPDYLLNDDEVIRGVALNALRKTPVSEADDLVASALIRDPSVAVRNVAIKVIGERPLSTASLNALDSAVQYDISTNIRHRAVRVLSRVNANPEALSILRWVAEHEKVERIRETAEKALTT